MTVKHNLLGKMENINHAQKAINYQTKSEKVTTQNHFNIYHNGSLNIFFGDQGSITPTCLTAAFMRENPKSAKRQSSHQCLFARLRSAHIKAAQKTLVKSTPN